MGGGAVEESSCTVGSNCYASISFQALKVKIIKHSLPFMSNSFVFDYKRKLCLTNGCSQMKWRRKHWTSVLDVCSGRFYSAGSHQCKTIQWEDVCEERNVMASKHVPLIPNEEEVTPSQERLPFSVGKSSIKDGRTAGWVWTFRCDGIRNIHHP